MKRYFLIFFFFTIVFSCKENTAYKEQLKDPELFQAAMKQLTDVIVYDIFSPPVASRVYAYPSIAAYEALVPMYEDQYQSYAGQLNQLKPVPDPQDDNINFHLASLHAFFKVGTTLIFSEAKMIDFRDQLYQQLEDNGLPRSVKKASLAYGEEVADHILAWADGN
jgi:hypothetical protein